MDPDSHARKTRALEEYAVRARNITRQPGLDAAALEALEALDAAGVDALVLKGAALARTLYAPDEHRAYLDIDLLVAPADLAAAGRVLAGLGYDPESELLGVDDVAGISHAELWSRLVPEFGAAMIDLHWRLPGSQCPLQIAWKALSAHRALIELAGRRVPTLDRSGLALHLALHTAQHGPSDLKATGDLERGLVRWPFEVWREARELARELDATEAFAAGLWLVPTGAEVAGKLALPNPEALLWEIAHRDQRPRGTFHVQAFSEARSLRARVGVVRRSLLPKRAWIVWEHPWAAGGGARLVAAYVMHVLRSPAWALAAWRFRRKARRQQRS